MATQWHTVLRTIVPAGVVGSVAFTICSQPAGAFFPPVTNGTTKVTTVPPVSPPPILVPPVIPPVSPPPFVPPPPPPNSPPPVSPPPVVTPASVPEPATIVTAAIGLAVAAGASRRKK